MNADKRTQAKTNKTAIKTFPKHFNRCLHTRGMASEQDPRCNHMPEANFAICILQRDKEFSEPLKNVLAPEMGMTLSLKG